MRTYLRLLRFALPHELRISGIAAAIWWVAGRILSGQLEPGKFFSFVAAARLLHAPVSGEARATAS